MMTPFADILAKSERNGGTTLVKHTAHVVCAIERAATALRFDVALSLKGAIVHDIGKVHPAFQEKLRRNQRDVTADAVEVPHRHEVSSLLFLPLFTESEWPLITDMVVAHHKSVKSQDGMSSGRGLLDLIESYREKDLFERHAGDWNCWSGTALQILNVFGISCHPISIDEARRAFQYVVDHCEGKPFGWSRWRGLLMAADHFASAMGEQTADYAARLFKEPNLSFYTNAERGDSLYPLSKFSTSDDRRHTIVSAPTGAGKTDYLLRRCHGRIFYTLPFQASINAMYERLKRTVPDSDIRALHASSRIALGSRENLSEERALQPLMGSSIKVLTPHQIAAIVFGTRGFEAIALDITNTDVILDEVHTYTKVARAMVLEIVRVLLSLNCRIHIGSATMPTALHRELLRAMGGEQTCAVSG